MSDSSPILSSVAFVDATLPDLATLLAVLPAGVEVHLIQSGVDGMQLLADTLQGRSGVETIHLLTHGGAGSLQLGSATLTCANLGDYGAQWATIQSALGPDADVLIYGCNVAQGEAGAAFVSALASLTGADVAASTDLTGAASLGGDWDLEASSGAIEATGITAADFDDTLALPGAHSATASSEVFIGGNYIELGISAKGSFGTSGSKPSGFAGTSGSSAIGMSNDADGFGNGTDLAIDYFLPGSPEERWAVGYNGTTTGGYSNLAGSSGVTLSGNSVTNQSSGDNLSAKFTGTVNSALKVEQTHSFKVNDKFFKTVVTLTNTSSSTMTDVRFMRSFDPDNTVYKSGDYTTVNKIENTIAAGDGKAVVSATSKTGDAYYTSAGNKTAKILFFSSDSRANVANFGFSNSDPYAMPVQAKGYSSTSDSGIAIMFKGGSLAAGASVTFEYFTSLDTADIATTIEAIAAASNPAPTLTTFTAAVDAVLEDTQVEITFAEIAAQGNEADKQPNASGGLDDATVSAFVVTSVTSGTLKIGADSGSATAWNPGTNDVIDATHKAYWTPAANANGSSLNAFKVVARDADGLKSSPAIETPVTVTAANDAPVIASATTDVTLAAINEDPASNAGATVSALFAPRFTDVDSGASLGGIIVVGNTADAGAQGKWQYSADGTTWFDIGAVATDNGLALSAATKLRFAPVADYNGTPPGISVYLTDNAYSGGYTSGAARDTEASTSANGVSTTAVKLVTKVNPVNDLPVFTSPAGAASLTETAAYDNAVDAGKVTLASGALTGTLAGSDVEGAVSFSIRGGSTSGSTVTKTGFYGTLTLDTGTKVWTYTPTNFTAINALDQGATATDNFEFKVVDSNGASATQALTLSFTGTNDTPVIKAGVAPIPDQTFNGNGTWSYQIPADIFSDAEGLGLTYTVEVVDSSGNVLDTITASTGGDTGKPSNWLIFNEATRTLTGTPTATAPLPLNIKVTASDGSASVSDIFKVTLDLGASDANPAPGNVAPTTTDDHLSTTGTTAITLTASDFGTFSDANGDALAKVKIVAPPSGVNGTLKLDGVAISAANTEITAADIAANKLTFEPGSSSAAITFQVGDGTTFSSTHILAVDVSKADSGVAFAASDVTTAQASTFTNVYSSDPLTGFSGTLRVVVEASGGYVKLSSLPAGVTAITTGYDSATGNTSDSIAFEGSLTDVNAALKNLQANLQTNPNMSISIDVQPGGKAYYDYNGHFYEFVTAANTTWDAAKTAAEAKTFNGLTGYLVTITSAGENAFVKSKVAANGWIGASDADSEGIWKWVTGPEANTQFWTGDTAAGTSSTTSYGAAYNGAYANWDISGEPNNSYESIGEDVAHFYYSTGYWNDFASSNTTAIGGYIVEYGGIGTNTGKSASRTITLTKIPAAPVVSIAGDAAYTENAVPKALSPALDLTDVDSTTLASATVTIGANKVAGDTLIFTNDGSTMGNILASFDAGSGTLSLSSAGSSATLAQWKAALKAVTFHSTSENPTNAARTIQWQVTDPDSHTSNVGSTSIAVTPVNDAPAATPLDDKTVNAGDAFNLTLGTVFADPEGTAVTYSAQYQDSNGHWQTIPASGTSYWLTFNPATQAFAGNPPSGLPSVNIKVIGSDGSASAETTFTLNLASAGAGSAAVNNAGTFSIADSNGGTVAKNDVLTAQAPVDADGYTPANVVYQWQVSRDSGSTWLDIAGATGQNFTVTQSESSSQVRAQAFYTDNGGFAEAPVSNALTVPALNVAGTATVTGSLVPGQTLIATLDDSNGLSKATPTYTWYRGDSSGAQTTVVGGNFSAYTLSNDDGGKYITVKVTYSDDEGSAETAVDSSDSAIQLGAVAPLAVNDTTGAATEASGVNNAVAGTAATGNVLGNDTDANTTTGFAVTGLRSGNAEGLGEIALLEGGSYVVTGDYGTLTVDAATGAYTYNANQSNYTVQALNAGQSVKDYFNYTVTDNTALSDIGVVEITINGANDAPSVRDLPAAFAVVEDQKTELTFPTPFALSDVDNTGSATVKLVASEGKLTAGANAGGVSVTGSDSGTLTLTGTLSAINAWLKTAGNVSYTSAPNDTLGTAVAAATITLKANDGVSGDVTLATVDVNVADRNNAPILDLNLDNNTADGVVPAKATGADLTGNDHAVVFRARGGAVQVVDGDITITDSVDGDTTLVGATVEITNGAWDNSRTIYETLSSTAGASYVGSSGTITITGNGTGTSGLTDATKLTLSGTASHADYQNALKTVMYNNSNEGAFAGNRTITLSVQDKMAGDAGLASNVASFTTTAANNNIAVGQKIYIAGSDTGFTVASVGADHQHFVASGPLATLANNASMAFWLDGAQVTTATAMAPLAATGYAAGAATSTVMVLWTPVVDLNGGAASGTAYTASYTEGDAGSYVSGTEALITDLDGNLKTVTLTLNNAADTASGASTETLFIAANIVTNLASNGITTKSYNGAGTEVANGTAGVHKIVFTGNKDATTFQQGLREVQYKNTSENPSVTPRTVTTSILDQDDNTGVSATTTINIVPRNDAPTKGGDYAGEVNEGGVYVLKTSDLNSTDLDDDAATLKYILTSAPDDSTEGVLFRDSNNNNVVDSGEALSAAAAADTSTAEKIKAIANTRFFTQAEVNAGQIKYAHSGKNPDGTNPSGTDTFGFKVVDGMEDYAFANIAANQAGTVTLTVTEVNDAPTGTPAISGTMKPGEVLTVATAGIADADGPATLVFSYQWKVSSDGTTWTNATGTGNTTASYTLADADQGKQVKVEVSFTDAFSRANTLTDVATGTVSYTNTSGGGAVTITDDGSPQAGETLTADTRGLTDSDGLGPYSYQWQVDTGSGWGDVAGATRKTYTLPNDAVTGAKYKVVVSYTDGRGNAESVASAEKTVVAPAVDVNDSPLLTGTGSFGAAAATGATGLFSDVAVSTVESGQTIQTLTLTVSGLQDGAAEKLTVDGVPVDLAAATTTAITGGTLGGMSYAVSVAAGTATVTLTHAGLTEAQTKALVEGLGLAGGSTAGLRVVTLSSLQDNGGTADSGHDTAAIGLSATVDVGNTLPGSNTTPTLSGDVAATVVEGGVVALAVADLAATDTEQPDGLQVVLASAPGHGTLFRDLNGNGIVDGAESALVSGSKFALADIAAGRIKYLHDGGETTSDGFTFNVSDGLAVSDSDGGTAGDQATTFNISVGAVNDAPTLTATAAGSSATPLAFAEGDAAKSVFSAAAASAVDAGQRITKLDVMVSGLRDGTAETLLVDGTSIALTHGTSGTSTGGHTVGYAVSVTGGTATVTLTKTDTDANWNGFIEGLKYQNTSQSPTAGQRSITLTTLTDDGADNNTTDLELTSVVAVTTDNNAPTLTTSAISVTEGGSIALTTAGVAASDADDALSSLTYKLSTAPTHGSLYIDANGNAVKDGGEAIATDGTGRFSHAQLAAGQVRYAHDGSENADSFALTVTDPASATSAAASIAVNRIATNDAPTLSNLGSDLLTYPANSGAKTLEQGGDVLLTDPDSANFGGGSLRVSVSFNRDPAHDVLSIQNVGTGIGQISVGAGTVSYAGTQIGTFTGGSGTADLVVAFNTDATQAAVTALVKAIQFSNDQAAPALTTRSVSFALNDGNPGGEAAPVAVNVNLLSGVAPGISIGNGFFVTENTTSVTTLSATDGGYSPVTFSIDTVEDATNNPDSAKFEIVSGNLLRLKTAPDYEIPDDAGADRTYKVVVKATNDIGSSATQALTVTVLDQDPEDGIVPGDTAGPVFGYATVNGSTLTMTYTDASNLDATHVPSTTAFTVSGNTVSAVAVNASAKTVILTLGTAVTAGQAVTVAYADPTAGDDTTSVLQDAGGNDAATLAAIGVSNVTPSTGGSGGGSGGGATPTPVDDADGVAAKLEDTAPGLPPTNGGTPVLGDGNGDGVKDSNQDAVSSLPFLETPTAVTDPGSAPSTFVTLVADSLAGQTDPDAGSAQIIRISQLDAPANLPAGLKAPLGLLSFASTISTSGASETFSFFVDASLGVNGYFKQNAAGNWVNVASSVSTVGDKTRLDFTIVDGGEFDADGLANGVIVDPGAPGTLTALNADTDADQFPDTLEAANGLKVGTKDNDVFTSSKFFAMQLYRDVLYREADSGGLAYWQAAIDSGRLTRAEVAVKFLDSPEFDSGVGAIARLYFGALSRIPDSAGMDYWIGQMRGGASLSQIANGFSASAEFKAQYGMLNDAAFVQGLYQNTLHRAPSSEESANWTLLLTNGTSRGTVALALSESAAYKASIDAELSVALDYLGLLGRPAEQAGYDYWLGHQRTDMTEIAVLNGFIASPEYHDRFLPALASGHHTEVVPVGVLVES